MLHSNKTKQLSRNKNQRNALVKTLAVSLVRDGKITTTIIKAKVLRTFIEKLISRGRVGSVAAQRLIASRVGPDTASKIMKEISPKYVGRNGGYTRITKVGSRVSDGSKMAQIEFV